MAENKTVAKEEMEKEIAKKGLEFVEITFNEDATEAYAKLLDPSKEFTKRDISWKLAVMDIQEGIIYENIDKMLEEKDVQKAYLVAVSQKAVDGKDGWYEFLFDTNVDTKPKILKDGSVDYSAYGNVPTVDEGDKIVIYHPATQGEDGVNFRNETLVGYKGKELAKLKGKGFTVSEDGLEYFAKETGKISYEDERLLIESELIIRGDASISTGDVEFKNDIHVMGNVLTGVKLHSLKGSIIVDGYVEAAELEAEKEIVLKNGMQGNGKGKISAGGSVSGKFFEQVTIESGEDIKANAIMNSHVSAKQDIIVSGKFGIIIGGEVSAEREISATIIGNMSEVKTKISAGVAGNLMAMLMKAEKESGQIEEELQKLIEGLKKVDTLIESGRDDLTQKRLQLVRAKIGKEQELNEKVKQKEEIMERMTRAHAAKVTILKVVYPGTYVEVNGVKTNVKEETNSIEIVAKGAVIQMLSLV